MSWLVWLVDEATAWSTDTIRVLDAWVNRPRDRAWRASRILVTLPIISITMTVMLVLLLALVILIVFLEAWNAIRGP